MIDPTCYIYESIPDSVYAPDFVRYADGSHACSGMEDAGVAFSMAYAIAHTDPFQWEPYHSLYWAGYTVEIFSRQSGFKTESQAAFRRAVDAAIASL